MTNKGMSDKQVKGFQFWLTALQTRGMSPMTVSSSVCDCVECQMHKVCFKTFHVHNTTLTLSSHLSSLLF